jgi:hypothetical protein
MRAVSLPPFTVRHLLVAAGLLASANGLHAQTAISGWTLSTSDASDSTAYSSPTLTFRNTAYSITSFNTGSQSFSLGTTASAAYVRRNTSSAYDNNDYTSTWVAQAGSSTTLLGSYQSSLSGVLLNNSTAMGADNVFTNSNNPAQLDAGNIERIDFLFSGGLVVNSAEGLTIFDRGAAGAHDSVKIAVFTGWTTSGVDRPTTYAGNVVTIDAADYGANLDWDPTTAGVQDTINYNRLRFDNGDSLTASAFNGNEVAAAGTQGVAGAFVSFASLGIASGTTIYGYSIMSSDTTTSIGNLADWTNAAYYPTNTADSAGGIDLMAFNGRIARPVPEPSTYGAIFLGLSLFAWWWHRRAKAAGVTSPAA